MTSDTSIDNTTNNTAAFNEWQGLGIWNFYFLIKFSALWYGYLNFHPFDNLIFLAFLLVPIPNQWLQRIRQWLSYPIGLALFYHDTWLPNIDSILNQGAGIFGFSPSYILELLLRFINFNMLGFAFILFVAYLFVSQWIRLSSITIMTLTWLNLLTIPGVSAFFAPRPPDAPPPSTGTTSQTTTQKASADTTVAASASAPNSPSSMANPPTNENLNAYIQDFYQKQKTLHTTFPAALPADAVPFDVLIIQICSMAWSDLEAVQLANHPLWTDLDILFTDFNSASSYSGPAAIRLLRASCGQSTHSQLYEPTEKDCYLMDNLANLGFSSQLMLDHTGVFGDFLKEIQNEGGLPNAPLMSFDNIAKAYISFNGSMLYNDAQLLQRWLSIQKKDMRTGTFFNIISLHDGNHSLVDNTAVPYKILASTLLDQLDAFLQTLEKSGNKTMVVILAEHGANLVGDKLQMSGLRDIPSRTITHIPAGVKFVGMKSPFTNGHLKIETPSSYLALSDLIARVLDGKIFEQEKPDLTALTKNLPETASVSENFGVTVMLYQGKPYVLLKGETNWLPYPQN